MWHPSPRCVTPASPVSHFFAKTPFFALFVSPAKTPSQSLYHASATYIFVKIQRFAYQNKMLFLTRRKWLNVRWTLSTLCLIKRHSSTFHECLAYITLIFATLTRASHESLTTILWNIVHKILVGLSCMTSVWHTKHSWKPVEHCFIMTPRAKPYLPKSNDLTLRIRWHRWHRCDTLFRGDVTHVTPSFLYSLWLLCDTVTD